MTDGGAHVAGRYDKHSSSQASKWRTAEPIPLKTLYGLATGVQQTLVVTGQSTVADLAPSRGILHGLLAPQLSSRARQPCPQFHDCPIVAFGTVASNRISQGTWQMHSARPSLPCLSCFFDLVVPHATLEKVHPSKACWDRLQPRHATLP